MKNAATELQSLEKKMADAQYNYEDLGKLDVFHANQDRNIKSLIHHGANSQSLH